jgi:hypothetical protein
MSRGYGRALYILPFVEIAGRYCEFVDLFERAKTHLRPGFSDSTHSEVHS